MSLCRTTNTTAPDNDNDNKDRRSFKQRDDDDASYAVANVKKRERERLISILHAIVHPTKVNYCLQVLTKNQSKTLNTTKKKGASGKFSLQNWNFTPDSLSLRARAIHHTCCLIPLSYRRKQAKRKKGAFLSHNNGVCSKKRHGIAVAVERPPPRGK